MKKSSENLLKFVYLIAASYHLLVLFLVSSSKVSVIVFLIFLSNLPLNLFNFAYFRYFNLIWDMIDSYRQIIHKIQHLSILNQFFCCLTVN